MQDITNQLEHVVGGRGVWKVARDVATAALSYFGGEQVPEIRRPEPNPPGRHDTRPAPQPPPLPNGVRIRR